ncbi:MAG TPA: imidazole glycerol phosphate synthase subunit HisH [Pyrinomonadaceae bacterium]
MTNLSPKIVIVDYRTGNTNSIKRALDRAGYLSIISSKVKDVAEADKLILPGVGHFAKAMANLGDMRDALNEAVLIKRKAVLGICLGMELMAAMSQEGNMPGLRWLEAEAIRFRVSTATRHKVPHMGWNRVQIKKTSALMKGVDDLSEFYFAHSYHLQINDRSDLLTETEYGIPFPSAVERDNIFGVQFHPEKSHRIGVQVLKNFIEM